MKKCKCCSKEITGKGAKYKKFCDRSCSAKYNNVRRAGQKSYITSTGKRILEAAEEIERMIADNCTIVSIRKKIGISTDTFKKYYPDYRGNPSPKMGPKKQYYTRKTEPGREEYFKTVLENKRLRREKIYEHIEQHGTTGLDTGPQNQKGWIKKYLIKRDGPACSQCRWAGVNPSSGKVMTELDHIDGDNTNNHVDNCRILCPNCHSLTPTYRNITRSNNKNTA